MTILGTTDIHANIYNWSYEDGRETENSGLAKVYSVVEAVRKENPNTILIDNGDTVQGTILSDDLYNNEFELANPVIDVMKPAGERIVELKFNGEEVKDTDTFKLAINNYRYGGMKADSIFSGEPYFESDPKSLRAYIADYIRERGEISPEFDNNWEVIGADLDHPLRDYVIEEINKGNIIIPTSEDGRNYNAKAINIYELIEDGLIPEELLPQEQLPEPKPVEEEVRKYTVKPGDVLWRIGRMYDTAREVLAEFNKLANPHLIYPGQVINIPN